MALRREWLWLPPHPVAVVARAGRLLRPGPFAAARGAGPEATRLAEVWTPLEPGGYVRVGRRLLPVRWWGPGAAPPVGGTVDLSDRALRLTAPGVSHPGRPARCIGRYRSNIDTPASDG